MTGMENFQHLLQQLPAVDKLWEQAVEDPRFRDTEKPLVVASLRSIIEDLRQNILHRKAVDISPALVLELAADLVKKKQSLRLMPVINATGVILHTNLGRSPLCQKALDNIMAVARGYSNLEFDLDTGKRGLRYSAVEELICELTGAQAAMVVNNNAGAVLLALNTLARNRKVLVSRGELVEIGGSFRIPDIMEKSGCILQEVGATNRTHAADYANALCEDTGLLLKVHTSNYTIQGFTKSVSVGELVSLGKEHGIPVMEDLGSGSLLDFSCCGLPAEPKIQDQVRAGANIVTFSGDKLLGGPQAGIIVGDREFIGRIRGNPLTRALRIDKLTLAALEATLSMYRNQRNAAKEIPALYMLTMPAEETRDRADLLAHAIRAKVPDIDLRVEQTASRPGGGAFPQVLLSGFCVSISIDGTSVDDLERRMRQSSPPVIGRIERERYILDPRTLFPGQEQMIATTIENILQGL